MPFFVNQPLVRSTVAYRVANLCFCLRTLYLRKICRVAIMHYGTPYMNRLIWLVCGIVLLMNPYTLPAQRRGGRGAGTATPPTGVSSTDDLKDFKRAIALQASPGQMVQFRQLTASTQAARKSAQNLSKVKSP